MGYVPTTGRWLSLNPVNMIGDRVELIDAPPGPVSRYNPTNYSASRFTPPQWADGNRYTYANNNPANVVDPSGLIPKPSVILTRAPLSAGSVLDELTMNAYPSSPNWMIGFGDDVPGFDIDPSPQEPCPVLQPKPKPKPKPKPPPKDELCKTVSNKTSVKKDLSGCNQDVEGVFLYLKQDTHIVSGKAEFVNVCYGCIDNGCAAKKPAGTYECGVGSVMDETGLASIHECRCAKKS